MNESSRAQGWAICGGAGLAALIFLIGILNGSYWAIAIPVATVTFFALGLVAWVGYTIATIQTDAEPAPPVDPHRVAESAREATSDLSAS